ncbi:hypothetical protein NDU88_001408 [Pleurodeles waltl]|uniref:Uncharacterized protein n=1 Tax=Pleurodeles waltl TaxID=8319 RepID=A0AAV7WLN9_PLEWA|nr:hypothetical protein NDU88_001408 [Pleurodeles waltl]
MEEASGFLVRTKGPVMLAVGKLEEKKPARAWEKIQMRRAVTALRPPHNGQSPCTDEPNLGGSGARPPAARADISAVLGLSSSQAFRANERISHSGPHSPGPGTHLCRALAERRPPGETKGAS